MQPGIQQMLGDIQHSLKNPLPFDADFTAKFNQFSTSINQLANQDIRVEDISVLACKIRMQYIGLLKGAEITRPDLTVMFHIDKLYLAGLAYAPKTQSASSQSSDMPRYQQGFNDFYNNWMLSQGFQSGFENQQPNVFDYYFSSSYGTGYVEGRLANLAVRGMEDIIRHTGHAVQGVAHAGGNFIHSVNLTSHVGDIGSAALNVASSAASHSLQIGSDVVKSAGDVGSAFSGGGSGSGGDVLGGFCVAVGTIGSGLYAAGKYVASHAGIIISGAATAVGVVGSVSMAAINTGTAMKAYDNIKSGQKVERSQGRIAGLAIGAVIGGIVGGLLGGPAGAIFGVMAGGYAGTRIQKQIARFLDYRATGSTYSAKHALTAEQVSVLKAADTTLTDAHIHSLRDHINKQWSAAKTATQDKITFFDSPMNWLKLNYLGKYEKSPDQQHYKDLMKALQTGNVTDVMRSPLIPDHLKLPADPAIQTLRDSLHKTIEAEKTHQLNTVTFTSQPIQWFKKLITNHCDPTPKQAISQTLLDQLNAGKFDLLAKSIHLDGDTKKQLKTYQDNKSNPGKTIIVQPKSTAQITQQMCPADKSAVELLSLSLESNKTVAPAIRKEAAPVSATAVIANNQVREVNEEKSFRMK